VQVGHASGALVHRREHLDVVNRIEPVQVPWDVFARQREHLLNAVVGRVGGNEGEVGPYGHLFDVSGAGGQGGVAGVDRVRGGHDRTLTLLAVDDIEARHRHALGSDHVV